MLVPRDRVERVDRRRWGSRGRRSTLGPGSQRTVGQEVVAGDDRVGRADRLREPPGPPAAVRTRAIVRIAEEDGVVEVEDEVPRSAAQRAQLPARQELALQNHRVELRGPAKLQASRKNAPRSNPSQRQRPTRVLESRRERPDPVSAADVIRRFDQGE